MTLSLRNLKLSHSVNLFEFQHVDLWEQTGCNKKLISLIQNLVQEPRSKQEFLDVVAKSFSTIAYFSNSITSNAINKQLVDLGKSISNKIEEYQQEREESKDQESFVDQVTNILISEFSQVLSTDESTKLRIKFDSSLGLLNFIKAIFKNQKKVKKNKKKDAEKTQEIQRIQPSFTIELAKLLVGLVNFLSLENNIFIRESEYIFQFLKNLPQFNQVQYQEELMSLKQHSRFAQLFFIYQENQDKSLLSLLTNKLNELALNDKELSNNENLIYFAPFLQKLTNDAVFKDIVYSQIEFMMKRNSKCIGVIAQIVSHLKSMEFTKDIVKMFTEELLSEEYLTKEESFSYSKSLIKNVALCVKDEAGAAYLLQDFLLKKFQTSKSNSNVSATDRQKIIKLINVAFGNIKKELVPSDLLRVVVNQIFDYISQTKDDALLKDIFDDVKNIFLRINDSFSFFNESVKKQIAKLTTVWHINLLTELLLNNKQDLNDILQIATPQYKTMLAAENTKTIANFPNILALSAYFFAAYQYTKDTSYITWIIQNDNLLQYLSTNKGFINTQDYFKKNPSFYDTRNHLLIIQSLLKQNYEQSLPISDSILRDSLFEFLLNSSQTYRCHQVVETFEKICNEELSEKVNSNLLKSLNNKLKEVAKRPVLLSRDELNYRPNHSAVHKIRQVLHQILKHRKTELTQNEFFDIIKTVCHPFISKSQKELDMLLSELDKLFSKKSKPFNHYFDLYKKEIVDFSIVQRTGILASDSELRKLAINMSVALASQGFLDCFVAEITQILDYKAFEQCAKLQKVLLQEFDRINHYELMFFSEITKDLLLIFKNKDETLANKELSPQVLEVQAEGGAEEEKKEPVKEAEIDPSKLAAQMLKAAAAQKKQAADAKKGGKGAPAKGGKPAQAQQQQMQKQKSEKEQPAQPTMDKEQRNKFDREQLLSYLQQIQTIKSQHIEAVLEIVKRTNSCKKSNEFNYLDQILNFLLQPMIKLLHYPYSKFQTLLTLSNLFWNSQKTVFFKIKQEVVSSLTVVGQNRIYQKNMKEFQVIFKHLEDHETLFSDFDKGYIKLILMLCNYILKDLSVNLSVKEAALQVTQSILDNNTKVNNIDLVRVTINMMKSSYVNKDLATFLNKLIRRINTEELALMVQRLFEYEPIPKKLFLQELVEFDMPLFCPVWFSTQMWILQFDDECSKVARRLWNKYGIVLRTAAIDLQKEEKEQNIFHYLRSNNTNVTDASIKALVSSIEIFQSRYDLIVDDLIEFYNSEMSIIEKEGLQASEASKYSQLIPNNRNQTENDSASKMVMADSRLNRIFVFDILKKTAHLSSANSFKKLFDFFILKGCLDQNETVSKASMEAALMVIKQKGSDYSEEILKILEKFINEKQKYSENCKNQAIIMIGYLASYLDNTSQKKLVGTFEKMLELLNTPSELIRISICKVIPQLARFFDDKSKKFLEDHLQILRESQDEKLLRGSAFAVSGIVKGLGMQTFRSLNILQIIQKECFSKTSDTLRKVSGLYLYETLSISLGKVFEMDIQSILPNIMTCISDPKDQVRRTALQVNKTIMSKFSNHAIKQVLPIFLNGLYVDNWRSKLASVEALGNMAFCAPKQISGFLPQIVKGVREVLNDTHEKVHAAALQAIQNIGSVIKCPEISEILQTLVKALSNPNVYLKDALKVLLDTSFVHAIDAPSLSLLVPILDSGLMMHDNLSKQLASKLMGNICILTQDPEDLLPYIKILMPAIKNSLFDSIPEIRASAAKAMGSLSKGLNLTNSQEMTVWLEEVLHQKQLSSSERSGAAQGFAEIISVHGVPHFEEIIKIIIDKCGDKDASIRESYRSVLLFLATCFDQFVKYLHVLLPIMIEGLSDDVEEVRKVSLRNVKICIKQFGKQAPEQLVDPIRRMMFDKDFRVRSSSSILMYQLVKELENDIIKSQPKYISLEVKNEILSAMFILKYDSVDKVAIQAAQIWKNIIDNQLKVLKIVINECVRMAFGIIMSEQLELQEMGLNCMKGIVEKFGEKIVSECLNIMESIQENAKGIDENIAVSKTIYNMVHAAPIKILSEMRNRFVGIVDPNLYSDNEEMRMLASRTFIQVFVKIYDLNYLSQTLNQSILLKMHSFVVNKENVQADLLIQSLKLMFREAAELKLEDKLMALCGIADKKEPFSEAKARVLTALVPNIADRVFKKKFYQKLLNALVDELINYPLANEQERLQAVLVTFSELLANIPESDIGTLNDTMNEFKYKCEQKGRLHFYVDLLAYYCKHSRVNYEKYAADYLKNVLVLMNDSDEVLVGKVIEAFSSIMEGLPKETQFTHITLIKEMIEQNAIDSQNLPPNIYKKKVQTIKMLEKPNGVKTLSTVIQNSITHGSIEIRIDSAFCFKYLIDFSKPEAVKGDIIRICGALIRVVNDKFPPTLKIQIFLALKLILLRASVAVKAMVPQLQTTFLKAYNDSTSTVEVRKVVVECLLLFLKIATKIDPIVKELTSMLDGDKIDNDSKVEVCEALALIIRSNSKSIQPAMLTQIQTSLVAILEQKKTLFNDKCITSIAFIVGILNTVNADELFKKYDNILDHRIAIAVKFGILLNGSALPNKEQLISNIEAYCKDCFSDSTGIEEIDNKEHDEVSEELEGGRLYGIFDILAFIGDTYIRRYALPQDNAQVYSLQFRIINQSSIFSTLNSKQPSKDTYYQVLKYLETIPVKNSPDGQFDSELLQIIKDGILFIYNYYLEFGVKKDTTPAAANMLMLNYNNGLDINEDSKLIPLTLAHAKSIAAQPCYASLQENLRLLLVELQFLQ